MLHIYIYKGWSVVAMVGWLVVLKLIDPLRRYFSLYQAVFQEEGERREEKLIYERQKVQTTPVRTWTRIYPVQSHYTTIPGAMVLGKLTALVALLIRTLVGQGPIALAEGAGGSCLETFFYLV